MQKSKRLISQNFTSTRHSGLYTRLFGRELAILCSLTFYTLSGCAGAGKTHETTFEPKDVAAAFQGNIKESSKAATSATASDDVQQLLSQLNKKIDSLESRLAQVQDDLDKEKKANSKAPTPPPAATQKPVEVIAHPSDVAPGLISTAVAFHDPDADFINDEPVQNFRKAMVLYQGQRYSDAILAFSAFLEKHPDHPMAGSAQFYIGESYMKQKEYKLALAEFHRVLTSYDRSAHISDTLGEMAKAEMLLKKPDEAGIHKHLLTSLFPQSPAANAKSGNEKVIEPVARQVPKEIPPTAPSIDDTVETKSVQVKDIE